MHQKFCKVWHKVQEFFLSQFAKIAAFRHCHFFFRILKDKILILKYAEMLGKISVIIHVTKSLTEIDSFLFS